MENATHYSRTRTLTAIAAALALSSTPVFAQQAQPTPADPPTPVTVQPAPVTDTAPTAPDTTTTASPVTQPSADVSGATTAQTTAPIRAGHMKRTPKVAARATAKPALVRASTHVTTNRTAMSTAVTPPPKPPAAPAAPVANQPSTATVAASPAARPSQQSSAQPATKAAKHDNTVPIAAGGVLALLAIGGAAVAINRRRPEDEEEWTEEYSSADEPQMSETPAEFEPEVPVVDEQAPIVAPPMSAFPWNGSEQGRANVSEDSQVEQDDRQPDETWVQRAYRGPSPLNPSVSLKTRLKRAAFFDKRERDAAAGLAQPVDPTSGLPDRMVEQNQQQQSSEFA